MKRNKKSVLYLFIAFLYLVISFDSYADLYWERVEVESRISKKIRNSLKGLLDREAFVVEVKVKLEELSPPIFDEKNKGNGLKVSDIKLDTSAGDYIALAKVGLEVPILEKYKKDEKIKNYFKKLFKYKENLELEKLIEEIAITIFLDNSIEEKALVNIKKIINGLDLKVGEIPPKIKFSRSALMLKKKNLLPKVPKKSKDLLYYIEKFALAIGLIVATFFLGIFGYILLKKWGAIIREHLELMNESQKDDDSENDEEDKAMSVSNSENNSEDQNEEEETITHSSGIERFKNLFESDQGGIIALIKRWILDSTDDSILILGHIVQSLSNDELLRVFEHLGEEYRLKWKNMLINTLSQTEEQKAEVLLADAIVGEIVSGEKISDQELLDIIISLSIDDAVSFITENLEKAPSLIYLLSPNMVSKILDMVDEDQAFKLLEDSVNIKDDAINQSELKDILRSYTSNSKYNPFIQKIKDMFAHISSSREDVLFKALSLEAPVNVLSKMAQNLIPSSLILKFPEHITKAVLQKYPLKDKVELLFSLNEDDRKKLLESFAKEGSNAREMIDIEMKILSSNDLEQKRITKKSDEIWSKFVLYTRSFMEDNDNYKDELIPLVDEFINKYYDEFITEEKAS